MARYSDDHTDSVMALTSWLRDHGINAICDMYSESEASQNPPAFIESHLPTCDFIIAVCSPSYNQCWQTPHSSQQPASQCHLHTETTPENSLSRLGHTRYEVFLHSQSALPGWTKAWNNPPCNSPHNWPWACHWLLFDGRQYQPPMWHTCCTSRLSMLHNRQYASRSHAWSAWSSVSTAWHANLCTYGCITCRSMNIWQTVNHVKANAMSVVVICCCAKKFP